MVNHKFQVPTTIHEGLVLYLSMDEYSGLIAYDGSGYSNDGTIDGASWVDGKFGKALSFDGINDYVKVLHSSSLALTHEVTITAWINFADTLGYRVIVRKVGVNWIDYGLTLNWDNNHLVAGITDSDGVLHELSSIFELTPNVDYFVGMTYNNSVLKLFVDGVLDNSLTINKDIYNSGLDFFMGSHAGTEQFFEKNIDEVRVYNRAKSEDEIAELYAWTGP
jgi:hypothetical protein